VQPLNIVSCAAGLNNHSKFASEEQEDRPSGPSSGMPFLLATQRKKVGLLLNRKRRTLVNALTVGAGQPLLTEGKAGLEGWVSPLSVRTAGLGRWAHHSFVKDAARRPVFGEPELATGRNQCHRRWGSALVSALRVDDLVGSRQETEVTDVELYHGDAEHVSEQWRQVLVNQEPHALARNGTSGSVTAADVPQRRTDVAIPKARMSPSPRSG